MAHHAPIRWVILPGNHDSLQATELWAQLVREAPANVLLATTPHPIPLSEGAFLLPAPCTTRRPGRDLSEWMDGASTPDGAIRIGLAHGAIQNFSEEAVSDDVIAPDRARRAGLDYLALGTGMVPWPSIRAPITAARRNKIGSSMSGQPLPCWSTSREPVPFPPWIRFRPECSPGARSTCIYWRGRSRSGLGGLVARYAGSAADTGPDQGGRKGQAGRADGLAVRL